MDDSEFEGILKEIDSHSSDPDFLNHLEELVHEYSNNFDFLILCIKYFPSLESEFLIYYFLCIFRIWINSDINLDLEIISEIKNIFFSQMKITSPLINAIQMSVQTRIFLKVYPNLIPSFWEEFLQVDMPSQLKLNFLDEFTNIFLNSQIKKSHKSIILNQMKNDNSELELIQYLLHLIINENSDNALMVLVKNLTFVDPFKTNPEENELIGIICSLINENIFPMIMNDLSLMPSSIIDDSSQLNIQDQDQLKSELNQIVSTQHEIFYHIENVITFLFHIISTNVSQYTLIGQIISEYCEKIQLIYQNSIELLNQLFDIQNSPQISPSLIEIYDELGVNLNNDIYSILSAVGNFISKSSLKFNDADITNNFYQPISLSLLKINNDDVSLPVVDFVKRQCAFDPSSSIEDFTEKIKTIFFSLSNRLTIYFLSNSIEKNSFYSSLISAIKEILSKANKQTQILEFYISSVLFNHADLISLIIDSSELKYFKSTEPTELELPVLSAMFQILDLARDKYINYSKIDEVLGFSRNLLEIRPPINSQQFFAITGYMEYIIRVAQSINDEDPLFQQMFESLYNFLIFNDNLNNFVEESEEIEQTSYEMKNKFISITTNLIKNKKFYAKVEVGSEQIVSLVKIGSDEIVSIASKIISKIPDDEIRFNIFKDCLNEMMELFSSSNDEVQSILSMLSFIQYESSGRDEESDEHTELILNFCEQLLETALKNETIFIEYLTTIQKVLDIKGIPIFLQCVNKFYDDLFSSENTGASCFPIETVTTICNIANLYIQHDEQNDWKFEAFCRIFDMVNAFHDFGEQDWSSQNSEEVIEISNLFKNFFLLSAHSCNLLDVKKNADILNYLEGNYPILCQLNSSEPLYNSLNYLYSLASFLSNESDESFSELIGILVEKFILMTFSIFKIEDFSMSMKWKETIDMIFKFHQLLISICHDETEGKLCFCFSQFPQSENLEQYQAEYIQLLCSEQSIGDVINDVVKIYMFLHEECNPSEP